MQIKLNFNKENHTFEQDHIIYLTNEEENIYSLIGNTLDSVQTRKVPDNLIQNLTILINECEAQKNIKPQPNIFSRCFSSLFGQKSIDNDQQKNIKLIDIQQKIDNTQIESSILQEQKRLSWCKVFDDVTKICEDSFYFCKQIREIHFSNLSKLQIIEKNAFSYSYLENLYIPGNVTLQKGWCSDTSKLSSFTIISNNPRYSSINNQIIVGKSDIENENYDILVFCVRYIKNVIVPDDIEIIDSNSFEYCRELQQVSFSKLSKLRVIDDYSFYLTSIQSITIPSSVTHLGKSCFAECRNLHNVSFSNQSKLEIIDEYAFSNSLIVEIEIPSNVTIINKYAFYSCKNLLKISFSQNSKLQIIGDGAFSNSSIQNFSFPLGVTQIQKDVFSNCKKLQQVSISSSITKICENAFLNCIKLQKVSFSKNSMLQIIEDYAFYNSSVQNFVIPSLVTQIGPNAFNCCSPLKIIECNNNFRHLTFGKKTIVMKPAENK